MTQKRAGGKNGACTVLGFKGIFMMDDEEQYLSTLPSLRWVNFNAQNVPVNMAGWEIPEVEVHPS